MMSEIDFQKLAEPFARHEVKSLTKRYQDKKTKEWREYTIRFITARSVMNRLDAVVGPQNWRAEFKTMMLRPDTTAVQCTLFLRIDGEWVGKSDIGTESDIEPEKGAVSDAMKRAAVHWGIGRELYGEGTAYDALGEQRTIDADTGEVTRSEAQPTTRGERSTHNPPKPSVADELPPAAQEQVDAYDATTDKRPLSQTTLPQLQQWIMGKYPNVTNISHASNTIIKALQEEGKLRADAGWAAVFGNGFVVAAVAEAVDRYESAEGNAPAEQPQLVEVPVPADTPQKRWKAG